MPYSINKTNGNLLLNLGDGTTNSDTGLILIGRNVSSYGLLQNENFVRLLENFAAPVPPTQTVGITALAGTLWWDTANQVLKIFNGTSFVPVSQRSAGTSAPTTPNVGDQWWDTANQQLQVWSGTDWILVGPVASATQGKTGAIIEQVNDTIGVPHLVIANYINGKVVSVNSIDSAFTVSVGNPNYASISTLNPGITVLGNAYLNGTATNSNTVGGLSPTVFARVDLDNALKNVYLTGNLGIRSNSTTLTYNPTTNGVVLRNTVSNGNIDIIVNNTKALHVNGASGLVDIVADPVNPTHIASKNYVDTLINGLRNDLGTVSSGLSTTIGQVASQSASSITAVAAAATASLNSAITAQTNQVATVVNNTNDSFQAAQAATTTLADRVTSVETFLSTVAPRNNAGLTGTPTAPIVGDKNNSNQLATTATVYSANVWLQQDYNTKLTGLSSTLTSAINAAVSPFAPKDNPTFTGTPKAPTQSASDASTALATTAFVKTAISGASTLWQGSARFISGSDPSPGQGNDGDFWFKIG